MKPPTYLKLILAPTLNYAEDHGYWRNPNRSYRVITPRTLHRMHSNHIYDNLVVIGNPRLTPRQAHQIQAKLRPQAHRDMFIEKLWQQVDH